MRAKEALVQALQASRTTNLVANSEWRRHRLAILCYHGVSLDDEHEWNPELYVTQSHLAGRLRFLRENGYTIVPLDEGLYRLEAGTLPPKSVALTFDDGVHDFHDRALPVLREFGAPATLYLTTYYCDHRYPVFDVALSYLLWKARRWTGDLAPVTSSDAPLRVDDPASRASTVAALRAFADGNRMNGREKHELLIRVAEAVQLDPAQVFRGGMLHIMSPDEVRSLPEELIDVELHTHRHRTPRAREEFQAELRANSDYIQSLRPGRRPLHFCYPSGDYSRHYPTWLTEMGVLSATTCIPGVAGPADAPLLLPRIIDTMITSQAAFESWVSGASSFIPRRAVHRLDPQRA